MGINKMAKALRHLGKPSRPPASPASAVLDRAANPHPHAQYIARFTAPEFTTPCPITGPPQAGGAAGPGRHTLRRPRDIEPPYRQNRYPRRPRDLGQSLAADFGAVAGLARRFECRTGNGIVDDVRIDRLGFGHGVERDADETLGSQQDTA